MALKSKFKVFASMLILFCSLQGITYAELDTNGSIVFPDPNLKAAILEEGADVDADGEISVEEARFLKKMDLSECEITSIEGLAYFTNLESLYLIGNNIESVEPLSELKNLEFAALEENNLTSTSLFQLPSQIKFLELEGNEIQDLSVLNNFCNLETVCLSIKNIESLSALNDLSIVRALELEANEITDIDGLSPLKGLRSLNLGDNSITDIGVLNTLPNLTTIDLGTNQISSIAPLGSMNLAFIDYMDFTLDLGNNSIEDISSLAHFTNFNELDLGQNQIKDLSPLSQIEMYFFSKGDNPINTSDTPGAVHDIALDITSYHNAETIEVWTIPSAEDAQLSVLNLSGADLYPAFDPQTLSYEALVTDENFTVTVEALSASMLSDVVINAAYIDRTSPKYTLWGLDGDTTLVIEVTSQNGSTLQYTIDLEVVSFEDPVAFADDRLKYALVEEGLGQYDYYTGQDIITYGDLMNCDEDLVLDLDNIQSLEGIQYLNKVTELEVDIYDVENLDLAPLGRLMALNELEINYDGSVDIALLSGLDNLWFLGLSDSEILNADRIEDLESLDTLDLWSTTIGDGSAIVLNDHMYGLYMDGSRFEDYSFLNDLNYLQDLAMDADTGLSDLTHFRFLKELDIDDPAGVFDLTQLDDMGYLRELNLYKNDMDSTDVLKGLNRLTRLELEGMAISDLSGLSGMTALKKLELQENSITDLRAISSLERLESLDLSDNQIEDISALSSMTGLTWLNLQSNAIHDISPLSNMFVLDQVYLYGNPINDENTPGAVHQSDLDFTIGAYTYEVWTTEGDPQDTANEASAGAGIENIYVLGEDLLEITFTRDLDAFDALNTDHYKVNDASALEVTYAQDKDGVQMPYAILAKFDVFEPNAVCELVFDNFTSTTQDDVAEDFVATAQEADLICPKVVDVQVSDTGVVRVQFSEAIKLEYGVLEEELSSYVSDPSSFMSQVQSTGARVSYIEARVEASDSTFLDTGERVYLFAADINSNADDTVIFNGYRLYVPDRNAFVISEGAHIGLDILSFENMADKAGNGIEYTASDYSIDLNYTYNSTDLPQVVSIDQVGPDEVHVRYSSDVLIPWDYLGTNGYGFEVPVYEDVDGDGYLDALEASNKEYVLEGDDSIESDLVILNTQMADYFNEDDSLLIAGLSDYVTDEIGRPVLSEVLAFETLDEDTREPGIVKVKALNTCQIEVVWDMDISPKDLGRYVIENTSDDEWNGSGYANYSDYTLELWDNHVIITLEYEAIMNGSDDFVLYLESEVESLYGVNSNLSDEDYAFEGSDIDYTGDRVTGVRYINGTTIEFLDDDDFYFGDAVEGIELLSDGVGDPNKGVFEYGYLPQEYDLYFDDDWSIYVEEYTPFIESEVYGLIMDMDSDRQLKDNTNCLVGQFTGSVKLMDVMTFTTTSSSITVGATETDPGTESTAITANADIKNLTADPALNYRFYTFYDESISSVNEISHMDLLADVKESADALTYLAGISEIELTEEGLTYVLNNATDSSYAVLVVKQGQNVLAVTPAFNIQTGAFANGYVASAGSSELSALDLDQVDLSPSFDSSILSYTANVGYDTSRVTLAYTAEDTFADVAVNGIPVSTSGSDVYDLKVGHNLIEISVTEKTGQVSRVYQVDIIREAIGQVLENLELSSGSLTPVFDPLNLEYAAYVDYDVSQVSVDPVVSSTYTDTYEILANDKAPGQNHALDVGDNVIRILVTNAENETVTYILTVVRAPQEAGSSKLASMTVNQGSLTPAFEPSVTAYTMRVGYDIDEVVVTPESQDENAAVTINEIPVTTTSGAAIRLDVGANPIDIEVTDRTGTSKTIYHINVTRAQEVLEPVVLTDMRLSAGTLSPDFDGLTYRYTASVANSVDELTLWPQTDDSAYVLVNSQALSNVTSSAAIQLDVGENQIEIQVCSSKAELSTLYNLIVTRAQAIVIKDRDDDRDRKTSSTASTSTSNESVEVATSQEIMEAEAVDDLVKATLEAPDAAVPSVEDTVAQVSNLLQIIYATAESAEGSETWAEEKVCDVTEAVTKQIVQVEADREEDVVTYANQVLKALVSADESSQVAKTAAVDYAVQTLGEQVAQKIGKIVPEADISVEGNRTLIKPNPVSLVFKIQELARLYTQTETALSSYYGEDNVRDFDFEVTLEAISQTNEVSVLLEKAVQQSIQNTNVDRIAIETSGIKLGIDKADLMGQTDTEIRIAFDNTPNDSPVPPTGFIKGIIADVRFFVNNEEKNVLNRPSVLTFDLEQFEFDDERSVTEFSDSLSIFRLDEEKGIWEPVGGQYDPLTNTISTKRLHLSQYTVMKTNKTHMVSGNEEVSADVNALLNKGIIDESTDFANTNVTREELASWITRANGLDNPTAEIPFEDMAEGDVYYEDIASGYAAGLFSGKSEVAFDPDGTVTREEMAVLLGKALVNYEQKNINSKLKEGLQAFEDENLAEAWSKDYMAMMIELDLMSTEEASLDPKGTVSKEMAASILKKIYS